MKSAFKSRENKKATNLKRDSVVGSADLDGREAVLDGCPLEVRGEGLPGHGQSVADVSRKAALGARQPRAQLREEQLRPHRLQQRPRPHSSAASALLATSAKTNNQLSAPTIDAEFTATLTNLTGLRSSTVRGADLMVMV